MNHPIIIGIAMGSGFAFGRWIDSTLWAFCAAFLTGALIGAVDEIWHDTWGHDHRRP